MSLQNRKIRWGIIGPGRIARSFASDLQGLKDSMLYAVASRSEERAEEFRREFKAVSAYDNYEDMVKDPAIDAVYIATPHSFHKEHTLLCLNHGIPVLCEKPFAMNLEEVNEMIGLAKKKKLLLMEALWTGFLPHYRHVLSIIESGKLGRITGLEADFGFKTTYDPESRLYDKKLGGGSLLDIGIYPVFLALSTLGIPDNIKANAVFSKDKVDTSCNIEFEYSNNVKAILKSTIEEDTPTTATLHFEKGKVKLENRFFAPSTVTITTDKGSKTHDFKVSTKGYNYEIMHFNELLRKGQKESDIMTYGFSEQLISLLDKIREEIGLYY